MGIAVSNATDVAKAAASMILTNPGLTNLIEAIKTGREVYRRMLTYTLNKVVKTTDIALFLSLGLLFENVLVIALRLVMFLMFVFSGLATVYLVRTRDHLWKIRPGKFLLISTIADILIVSSLAYFGVLMEPLSLGIIFF